MRKLCLSLAALMGLAAPALAGSGDLRASACVKRADLIGYPAKESNDVPIARGIADSGAVFAVYSHRDNATWTITVTMPDGGATCMVATGNYWEELTRILEFGPTT